MIRQVDQISLLSANDTQSILHPTVHHLHSADNPTLYPEIQTLSCKRQANKTLATLQPVILNSFWNLNLGF